MIFAFLVKNRPTGYMKIVVVVVSSSRRLREGTFRHLSTDFMMPSMQALLSGFLWSSCHWSQDCRCSSYHQYGLILPVWSAVVLHASLEWVGNFPSSEGPGSDWEGGYIDL